MTITLKHVSLVIKAFLLASMAINTACSGEDGQSSAPQCKCMNASPETYETNGEVIEPMIARYDPTLTGRLKLTPPPKDRVAGPVMIYIDEMHVFGSERRRIIEKEITINYEPKEEQLICGTVSEPSYRSGREYCSCDEGYSMTDPAPYNYGQDPKLQAVARGDIESIDSVVLELNFQRPDLRSRYFIGIHIDFDQDGTVSEGDYFTKEFVEAYADAGSEIYLVAEQLKSERAVATGVLDLGNLPALGKDALMQVTLFDISSPTTPRKVASVDKKNPDDLTYELRAVPDSENAIWQLSAWVDRNSDGKLDACDYVERERQVRYSLSSLQGMRILMAYAGGSPEECEEQAEEQGADDGGS